MIAATRATGLVARYLIVILLSGTWGTQAEDRFPRQARPPASGPGLVLETIAGNQELSGPMSIVLDQERNVLYIADTGHHCIRRVRLTLGASNADPKLETMSGICGQGVGGDDGATGPSRFAEPYHMVLDHPGARLMVLEKHNDIRFIDLAKPGFKTTSIPYQSSQLSGFPTALTLVGGSLMIAIENQLSIWFINCRQAVVAQLPTRDSDGDLYTFQGVGSLVLDVWDSSYLIAETGANRIMRLTFPAPLSINCPLEGNNDQLYNQLRNTLDRGAEVTVVAGSAAGDAGDGDGDVQAAEFNQPASLTIDPTDRAIYVADRGNNKIRVIRDGKVSTVSILGTPPLLAPSSVAVWRHTGELFVAEPDQHMVRMAVSTAKSQQFEPEAGGAGAGGRRSGWSAGTVLFLTFFVAAGVVAMMIAAPGLNRRVQGFVSARRHRVVVPKSYARGTSF